MARAARRFMRLAPAVLLALLAACVCGGPHGDEPQDDPSCVDPSAFAAPSIRQGRAYLLAVAEGATLPITRGPQGGCMVTPTVCVEAPWIADESDSECMILSIENAVVDTADPAIVPAISTGSETMVRFDRSEAGVFCASSVWNYLDDCSADLDGTGLSMRLEVRGVLGEFASGQTSVVLEAPEAATSTAPQSPWS